MILSWLRKRIGKRMEPEAAASREPRRTEKMNARLLAITESAHDMIATFDLRGEILYLNRAGFDFLGIRDLHDKNGQLERYMSVPETLRLVDGLRIALEQGYWQDESEWITENGVVRTASQTVVAHVDEGGGEPYFSTIVRDISDRKEIERQLIVAKQAADEANEAKSAFLARMSHELRTPLGGIIGLAQLLQRTELSDTQRDYCRQIAASGGSLLHILNDLLDYSKLEADKLTIENLPFRLDDSLERLSGTFAVLLGSKPVDLILKADPGIPEILYGDHVRLEQVLLNLVGNAIKFTEQGYIVLEVSVSGMTEDAKRKLCFTVTDTGIGMKPEQLAGMFQPFVQADEATSRTYGGTGLGLVICRSLIRLMGGEEIRVESRYREGSAFRFELPFDCRDGYSPPLHQEVAGTRVLVLEDSSVMRDHWKSSLTELGCIAETAPDWMTARRLLEEGSWDVWIADMEAADMYGNETWEEWKEQADVHGVVILCSTSLQGRDALLSMADHARPAGVLVKPAVRQQLLHSLSNLRMRKITDTAYASSSRSPYPGLQGTVLVVEDNEINRIVAKELLEGFGLRVMEADNGWEAIQQLERHRVQLVLIDLQMPVMDGIEAARRIRQDARLGRLPIIAMTAGNLEESRGKCLQAGMNDLLPKPVEPGSLHRLLAQWLPSAPSEAAVSEETMDWPDTDALDIPLALHRLEGKSALYLRLLDRFCAEYEHFPAEIRSLIADASAGDAERLLHSFRGAAAHLGAIPVAREARVLEEALRRGLSTEEHLALLEERLQELIGTIRHILGAKRS